MSITQRAEPPDTPHANDELLTMKEVADVVRVAVATFALLAPPRVRPTQLPCRSERPLLAHRNPALARTAEQRSSGIPLRLASASR
jgi:hypothetical protein